MRIHATILAILLLGVSTPAHTERLVEQFDRVDRNGDGKVTPQELPRPALFRRLDRNGDGVIERSEVTGGAGPAAGGRQEDGRLDMPDEPPYRLFGDIRYAKIEGVDPNLLSLDVYAPKAAMQGDDRPVLIMVHGGGWRRGDKTSPGVVGAKMRHFVSRGYIYAGINYRLSAAESGMDGVQHPVHAQDCAKAIAWVHENVRRYGGDPRQLHLMGHSAGGHLAGLLATNERFLKAEGKRLSILKTTVLLDPAALDIPRFVKLSGGRGMTQLYENAFGTSEPVWRDASPQCHVSGGKGIPPMLVFCAGDRMRLDLLAPAFAASLTTAGSPSRAVDTVTLDHAQINAHIGMIGDPMTALVMRLHAGEDPRTFPERIESRAADGGHAASAEDLVTFTRSYVPGTRDTNGRFMGGTETMRIVAHDGKLFAGLS